MKVILTIVMLMMIISCGENRSSNEPPFASFTIKPLGGTVETIFLMDASESTDNEDLASMLKYRWDWESDGIWDTDWLTKSTANKRFTAPGVYQVSLEVIDTEGLSSLSVGFVDVDEFVLSDLRDGKQYKTVKIGDQLWMAENLNYETSIGSWCHSDKQENCVTYGRLYDWETALVVCPAEWKLPTRDDWDILIAYVGENPGDQLRADFGWNSEHNGNNSSGFTALPASFRNAFSSYAVTGSYAYFWETTEYDDTKAWSRLMFYNRSDVERNYQDNNNGFSVRCLKIQ